MVDILAGHRLPTNPHQQRLTRARLRPFGEMPVDDHNDLGRERDIAFRTVLRVPQPQDRMLMSAVDVTDLQSA